MHSNTAFSVSFSLQDNEKLSKLLYLTRVHLDWYVQNTYGNHSFVSKERDFVFSSCIPS
jgi:hypothetical protein